MRAKQQFFVLTAVLIFIILTIGGLVYGINKELSTRANKLATLKGDAAVLDTVQVTLAKNKQDITKYADLNKIAEAVVPQDKDQAEAVREIVNLAAQSGLPKLSSITFPASTLGVAGPGAKNTSLTQLLPVKGMAGVYQLSITVTQDSSSSIPYTSFIRFLQALEQNRRTAQVSSISITPNPANPSLISFTLAINEYIKP